MRQAVSIGNPLGTERIEKLIVRYSIPSIISIVVNSLYNMVDQVFIGQSVGYLGNAATNIILPLTVIMLAISMLIGDGTASYMSLNLGKGRERSAAYGVGNAVTLLIGISVVLLIIFEIFFAAALPDVWCNRSQFALRSGIWTYYNFGLSLCDD